MLKGVRAMHLDAGFLVVQQPPALRLDQGLTVITGPNGAGKSNLARTLDVVRAVLAPHDAPESERLDLYREAGFEGATEFTVKLDVVLDQPWEQGLIRTYVRAAYVTAGLDRTPEVANSLEESADWLVADSLKPLLAGTLVVRYRATAARPWAAYWEFAAEDSGATWHAVLVGDEGIDQLRPGAVEEPIRADGGVRFADWLMQSKPQDAVVLDFRVAMRNAKPQPVTFSAGPSQAGRIPGSLQELALSLGIGPVDRSFSFRQVMNLVLQRGIVLTDNRRLPLQRRFPLSELGGPFDLRDGAAVGGEIFRLKNGDFQEKERFRQIQSTFRSLTGRDLDVRARPADNGEPALVIEPTVTGQHSERPVELSGAGIQEALVLSTLLRGVPGRITVLDEPAVNLEPTVQRRLVRQVRGPGQYLVITHSADLVPFGEPDDLKRIVRLAPGASGSWIRQADYGDANSGDQFRQLQLMQPAEIRSLLFAQAAVLCEGQTEVGALPRWWNNAHAVGLPDLGITNVSFVGVDGHNGYGAYIRFLDAYGIPWVIVSDGPGLRKGQRLRQDMRELGHWPDVPEPSNDQDFAQWRSFWERAGVFTLATRFGDDGSKSGEFEALLRQIDVELLGKAMTETGKSKPRAGAYFAAAHPELPDPVRDLFRRIAEYLHFT
jgi:energy-coupling factor transporter ATP-binding protein EcfA2